MAAEQDLSRLETPSGYRESFMDVRLWQPHIRRICLANGWTCTHILPGREGTFPTFIVDEQRVLKFYGRLFDGLVCRRVELECSRLMAVFPAMPTARVLGEGALLGAPGWEFLVFEYVPGVSLAEVYDQVSFEEKERLARRLGEWLALMHRLEVSPSSTLPVLGRDLVQRWFDSRWVQDRSRWPRHLADQVEGYLARNASCLQPQSSAFIHADLTQDHFLGDLQDRRWITRAVIDFGDAMRGDLYYELIALHLDLFLGDKRLLAAFLHACGFTPPPDFIPRAMVASLMHQFDVIGYVLNYAPALAESRTLEQLADRLWDLADTSYGN